MSDSDVPAGQADGPSNVSGGAQLPDRLRVHALARLIDSTSRQVLGALEKLGFPAKGAQSNIDRDVAVRVVGSLGASLPAAEQSSAASADPEAAEADVPAGPPAVSAGPPVEPGAGALPFFTAPTPMFLPPAPATATGADSAGETSGPEAEDHGPGEDGVESKRRRRRGRRGRGRGKGSEDDTVDTENTSDTSDTTGAGDTGATGETGDPADDGVGTGERAADRIADAERSGGDEPDADDSPDDETGGGVRRRRRRRRRASGKESGPDSDTDPEEDRADRADDPPNTVTRVREARARSDGEDGGGGIQGVRGSTRLEAKRQRRRDGRDAGRRRAPLLSEAEFLARRESVQRTMVVRQRGERSEIGVLEDGVLVEHFVTSSGGSSLVGNVYLGRVQNVLPSMEAAFVDIGRGRNAVLYAGEVDWDSAGLAGKARRIEQALTSGDSLLVQVTKDPVGHKGARLTTQISLPGRFLVYVPSGGTHGISRKLPDTERRRLKDLLREIVPEDAGVIIRTASEGVSQESLERDVRRLQAQWEVVKNKADAAVSAVPSSRSGSKPGKAGHAGNSKVPDLLYEEPDLMIKVIRDQFNEDFTQLVVEGEDAWDTLHAYVSHVAPELTERLRRHVGTTDIFTEYRIDEQLLKALDRKVWLPSGGTLVIDRTEAMTVIDVNTGKFTGSGGNLEQTVTRNNLEAAEEIVRQLRLRDMGGIIVIDFIDMVLESNRDLVLRRLVECLGRDRTRHQVAEVTSLGLVQMTRKRVGAGLLEAFSIPCEHCRGRGVVVSTDPVEQRVDPGGGPPGLGGVRRRGRGGDQDGHRQQPAHGIGNGHPGRPHQGHVSDVSDVSAADAHEHHPSEPNGRPVPAPVPGPVPGGGELTDPTPAQAVVDVAEPEVPEPEAGPPATPEPGPAGPPAPESSAPEFPAAEMNGHAGPEGSAPVGIGVGLGASSQPTPRPRRRRRVASRPAGPPSDNAHGVHAEAHSQEG